MSSRNEPHTLSSIEKSFEVIEFLSRKNRAGVTHIANELGYHKATVHSHLRTLLSLGYITRVDGKYELSLKFLKQGGIVRKRLPVYKAAKNEVQNLASETNELVNLGVEQNGKVVVIYMVEGTDAVHDDEPTGKHTLMHHTALGKAILSQYPRDRVQEIIEEHGTPEITNNTITDRSDLYTELDEIRTQGFAVDNEEGRKGIKCIAVPITNGTTESFGAISVTGPKGRLSEEAYHEEIITKVQNSVNVVEIVLNHN